MGRRKKHEIITFKVDQLLSEELKGIENRSEFIRGAIQAALAGTCPLCKGSGTLSADQRRHWEAFAKDHPLRQCADCHAVHPVCQAERGGKPR
jgi:hypothetical protein